MVNFLFLAAPGIRSLIMDSEGDLGESGPWAELPPRLSPCGEMTGRNKYTL